ncbi:TBC1 domain family member 16 [Trachymyrmex cornetzi]|uniref:TBC1 domain family member 16 n=1 Tax=Trachymyrmex cornetzi TaxID=471704 RepID=A0A151JNL8_9HYME|nr:TBC1 domain family member 16 [Trachymyrmex cornetzi]
MPLPNIWRKASNYILGECGQDNRRVIYQDGEALFCKNNVCVHPPTLMRQHADVVHHPGYMTITCKLNNNSNNLLIPTLHLSWIPNSTLRKHPTALENLSSRNAAATCPSSRIPVPGPGNSLNVSDVTRRELENENENEHEHEQRDCFNEIDTGGSIDEEPRFSYRDRDDVSVKSRSLSLTSTCSWSISVSTDAEEMPSWMRSPELLALQHNLVFPESATASPVTLRRAHRCRKFSVDLSEMRSLRLFFADPACTCGQLVVASRESQYKILHFHHGGLDRLHFMVCRPEVSRDELHPEEGQVPMITSLAWKDLLNERGQMEDDLALRKGIFFGGLEPALRKIVWPFLLHCYSYQSTYEDREQIDAIRQQEYEEIQKRRLSMNPEQAERFWRNVVCIVEKDVVRTDRANPYYAGEGNPNVEIMKNILLNYAVYNCRLGYTQGMSDLLAPLLAELNSEIEAFWCFAGLMQRSVAVCTPTDTDMDRNLCYLRELVRIMVPDFYTHLQKHADALELLFCHRWILLCLKREFPTEIALVMWEACWVNYLTDHFHLFLCLAIMCVYADDVIAQDLRTDEMLLHFSSLAMYMDGNIILRKARGLLHHFRQLVRLPCTLAGLCRQCGPGMWDSAHDPVIECVGHEDTHCPYLNNYE